MTPDLTTWLTKPEAAERMGISVRSLERLTEKREGPECRERPRPGVKPEPVFNPDDVTRWIEANNKPAVFAAKSTIGVPATIPPAQPPELSPSAAALVPIITEALIAAFRETQAAPSAPQSLWLTLPEATAYSGLSAPILVRLIRAGKLRAIRDVALKVRAIDLANLANLAELAEYGQKLFKATNELRELVQARKAGAA